MITLSSPAFLFGTIAVVAILIVISFTPSCKLVLEDIWCGPAYPYKPGDHFISEVAKCVPGPPYVQCTNFWDRPAAPDEYHVLLKLDYDDLIPPCDPHVQARPPIPGPVSQTIEAFQSKYKQSHYNRGLEDFAVPDTFRQHGSRYLESGYRVDQQDFAPYFIFEIHTEYSNDPPQLIMVSQCGMVRDYFLLYQDSMYAMPTDAGYPRGTPDGSPTWSDEEVAEIVRDILSRNGTE